MTDDASRIAALAKKSLRSLLRPRALQATFLLGAVSVFGSLLAIYLVSRGTMFQYLQSYQYEKLKVAHPPAYLVTSNPTPNRSAATPIVRLRVQA